MNDRSESSKPGVPSSSPQRLDLAKLLHFLEPNGALSSHFKHYEPREAQKKMLTAIVEAYNKNQISLIEAGTGTGKSIAYLLPAIIWALLNKERTLISTNTINLQEQLLNKDIPVLVKALGVNIKAVLVKGMGNYLCLRKLKDLREELGLFAEKELQEIQTIEAWADTANEGSRSELPIYPSAATWEKLKAEGDACSHQECPHYNKCFFFKARQEAEDANILISNHHMLFADVAYREKMDNKQSLIPDYQRLILDEAHNIEEIASDFFAEKASQSEIIRYVGRLSSEKSTFSNGKLALLRKKLQDFYGNQIDSKVSEIITKLNIDLPGFRRDVLLQGTELFDAVHRFIEMSSKSSPEQGLHELAEGKLRLEERHENDPYWQEIIINALGKFCEGLSRYLVTLNGLELQIKNLDNPKLDEQTKSVRFDISSLINRLAGIKEVLLQFTKNLVDPERVKWLEVKYHHAHQNISLVNAELDISQRLVQLIFLPMRTVILCSATLTTNKSFKFIRKRIGLDSHFLKYRQITELQVESPFDYLKQALFAVPTDLPSPLDEGFVINACEKIWQAIQASQGGAFVLFTSYQMLLNCYQYLADRLALHRYPVFKQGDSQRQELLKNFRNTPRSILFGTDSFWEGVDVVGDSLRCVIIVKLPFRVPSEPMIAARCDKIKREGGNPFQDYVLPQAIVKFKQGFGRLIRNKNDRGCIVCLDNRLANKSYGNMFLNSLPECTQIIESGDAIEAAMRKFYKKKP